MERCRKETQNLQPREKETYKITIMQYSAMLANLCPIMYTELDKDWLT